MAIEQLSLPDNVALLDEQLSSLPPPFEVNRAWPPLNQALHLYLIARNTPGVSFPFSQYMSKAEVNVLLQESKDKDQQE